VTASFHRFSLNQTVASACKQPFSLTILSTEAGFLISNRAAREGRRVRTPPQFGQVRRKTPAAQSVQNVHSNEQITASSDSGASGFPQHSQN
jgi:hypothetical protein